MKNLKTNFEKAVNRSLKDKADFDTILIDNDPSLPLNGNICKLSGTQHELIQNAIIIVQKNGDVFVWEIKAQKVQQFPMDLGLCLKKEEKCIGHIGNPNNEDSYFSESPNSEPINLSISGCIKTLSFSLAIRPLLLDCSEYLLKRLPV